MAATPGTVDEGQSVTLTSVVFGDGDDPFPSGTVDFVEGTRVLGSAPTSQVGTTSDALASLRIVLASGRYPTITAAYHPDAAAQAFYAAATSASTAAVTVERVAASTTLSVATSLNPSPTGRALIVTATVNHPSSSLTPTGTITFTVNGTGRTAVAVDSLGQASLTVSSLAVGTQSITASYSGDGNFSASTGSAGAERGRARSRPRHADGHPPAYHRSRSRTATPPSPKTVALPSARRLW